MLAKFIFLFAIVWHINVEATSEQDSQAFEQTIHFQFYKGGQVFATSNSQTDDLSELCDPSDKWLIMTHGFNQNCSVEFIIAAVSNFEKHRGGCIVCMDYSLYTSDFSIIGYEKLVNEFDPISNVLLGKLQQFERDGFEPSSGHLVGHSFGSQVIINAGRDFGGRLSGIDACEPAGPGFQGNPDIQKRGPAYSAAKNVQCIHTSTTAGTSQIDCHQNWLMGNCGVSQNTALKARYGDLSGNYFAGLLSAVPLDLEVAALNHNACTSFYNAAFEYDFPAIDNHCCAKNKRNANPVPQNYLMGYNKPNQSIVQKKYLFAYTYINPPYNVPSAAGELSGQDDVCAGNIGRLLDFS